VCGWQVQVKHELGSVLDMPGEYIFNGTRLYYYRKLHVQNRLYGQRRRELHSVHCGKL